MLKINKLAGAIALSSAALTSQADGILEGRIIDASTQNPINGVVVSIKDLNRDVLVNNKGAFRLPKLKAGTYEVVVTLGDQSIHQTQITITDNEVTRSDITIDTADEAMEEIVVVGQAAQMQRALDRQRHSDNMISAINADAIGQLPDSNAAEALQRIAGISIERDQGEGRFVRVRGISPDLNAVTVNGTQLPAPESGRRAVALDVIPSDLISSLVVTKALTPDMDANAIGGSIEVESLSALDREGAFYTVNSSMSYDEHTSETSPSIAATGGNTFEFSNGHRLGVASAISYDKRKFGSDNVETGAKWDGDELEELEQRDYTLERERIGAALNLDYEIDLNNSLYARTLYSKYTDDEQRLANVIEFGAMEFDADEGENVFEGGSRAEGDTGLAEVNRELKDRAETQTILSTTLGGEHFIDDWTVEYAVGYSKADEDEPGGISGAVFKQEEVPGMGFNNSRQPDVISGSEFLDASAYELDKIEYEEALTEDVQTSFKFDITKDLYFNDNPAIVKFGAKSSQRKKSQQLQAYEFEDFTDNGFTDDQITMDKFTSGSVDYNLGNFGPNIDPASIQNVISQLDKSNFINEEDSAIEDYEIEEDINAAYLMGRIDLEDTRILAGVRYEGTKQTFEGYQYDDGDITLLNSKNDYDHILPSLHVKHELGNDSQLRFAYSNAVVRPTFEQLSPGTKVDGDETEKGNTNLKAMESANLDFGWEIFTGDAGAISAFVFHKDIKNFTYETEFASIEGADVKEITTYDNGESATLTGIELGFSQKLSMLPSPFNGVLIGLNAAYSESDASISAQEEDEGSISTITRDIPLPNQSDMTGNFILGYEKNKIMLRLAANYKSEYLLEVNNPTDKAEDVYQAAQTQWDFSAAYNVLDNLKVTFEVSNLTDEPYYTYQDNESLNAQYEDYGPTYRVGLTFNNF